MKNSRVDRGLDIGFISDLLRQKLNDSDKVFMRRVAALHKGDLEKVTFIENMYLKPLDAQTDYLVNKLIELTIKLISK